MNIALLLQHKLLLGIQRFMWGNTSPMQPITLNAHTQVAAHARLMPRPIRTTVVRSGASAATQRPAGRSMPLRVLHEVEGGMPRSSTGRLVISGRMADVCAELDRLVEREAALH